MVVRHRALDGAPGLDPSIPLAAPHVCREALAKTSKVRPANQLFVLKRSPRAENA
jgi:hypothetical protein